MGIVVICAVFGIGVACQQVYGKYRDAHEIPWASVAMGLVFLGVALIGYSR